MIKAILHILIRNYDNIGIKKGRKRQRKSRREAGRKIFLGGYKVGFVKRNKGLDLMV